jgi:hypothetical protein
MDVVPVLLSLVVLISCLSTGIQAAAVLSDATLPSPVVDADFPPPNVMFSFTANVVAMSAGGTNVRLYNAYLGDRGIAQTPNGAVSYRTRRMDLQLPLSPQQTTIITSLDLVFKTNGTERSSAFWTYGLSSPTAPQV